MSRRFANGYAKAVFEFERLFSKLHVTCHAQITAFCLNRKNTTREICKVTDILIVEVLVVSVGDEMNQATKFLLTADHQKISPFILPMALKRKSTATMPTQPTSKGSKVAAKSEKRSAKALSGERPQKVRKVESSDEEEFRGFGSDDEIEEESISEEDESMEDEEEDGIEEDEDELDEEDDEEEDEEGDEDEGEDEGEDEVEDVEDEETDMDNQQANGTTKPKEKEVPSRAAQRILAKERKLQKPHAPQLHRAKQIWESLRQRNQSKSDRQKQVDELFEVIKGDIPALVFGHSASRFVQTAMKYGSVEQRMAIAKELEGRYVELAKGKYGKFLVTKILEYGYYLL